MTGPLSGVKVLDMTTVFMGPHCTQILAEHGAEVIKLEAPEGDIIRHIPPMRNAGMGALFLLANRGKRGIVLDLKKPAGREAALKIAARCDVLVYNVRPAAMQRLSLSYADVKAVNARIIYAGAFGYGQDGPYAGKPAYDDLIQAASGLASLPQRVNGGEPRYVPSAIVDRTVALAAVNAVTTALFHRERTGQGQAIDVPMFETMAHLLLGDHLYGKTFDPPRSDISSMGYPRLLAADRRPYKTKDGYIGALVYTDKHWTAFLDAINRGDLRNDARFESMASRTAHIAVVYAFLAETLATRTNAEWLALFDRVDIPAMPMHRLEDLLEDPHLRAVNFFQHEEHPSEGGMRTMRNPATWSATPLGAIRPAPRLGEHSREVLREVGYADVSIDLLMKNGASSEPSQA
jgi:crotonobetainyl-CoA:carnitine CoA-transferase CaiB-like acyl-CoA transferase